MVQIKVLIPHHDGLLPAISTQLLSNFDITLSHHAFRNGLHKCSNMLDFDEKETTETFLTEDINNGKDLQYSEPYQYDPQLRGTPTLRFYR